MATNKIYGREELKDHFRNGKVPTELHFAHLIDSTINKQEDGFSKDEEHGMLVAALGASDRLVSFYRTNDDLDPFYVIEKDERENPALRLQAGVEAKTDAEKDSKSFFFHNSGSLGIGTQCSPGNKLEVDGFAAMQGRVGSFKTGVIAADGAWYPIVSDLDNCQAFEVMARTGIKGSGKFAIMHAIAVSAFGGSHGWRIRRTRAHYGFFWNRLQLRWKGSNHKYELQLRTNSNYGPGVDIHYKITRLWDDEAFMPLSYYY
jgi:hypothetical protein